MTLSGPLVEELKHEAAGTRKMLELITDDKLGWQPHDKSMTLGRLAAHIAEIPGWLNETIRFDELDVSDTGISPRPLDDAAALLQAFDETLKKGVQALESASDENLLGLWSLRHGEQVFFTMPRIGVVRGMILNHIVHHRGQLSVYLRLLNIPVPGMYGPSADDMG